MAKAHFVKRARKDNPAVSKGESYWWWKFMHGRKRYSATKPTRSQLTQSEYYSTVWALQDGNNFENNGPRDLLDQVEAVLGDLEELRDETQEKFDAVAEHFEGGETYELLEQRVEVVEEATNEMDDIRSELDDLADQLDALQLRAQEALDCLE